MPYWEAWRWHGLLWLAPWLTYSEVYAYLFICLSVQMKVNTFVKCHEMSDCRAARKSFSKLCRKNLKKYFSSTFILVQRWLTKVTLHCESLYLNNFENVNSLTPGWIGSCCVQWIQCPHMAGRHIPVRPPGDSYCNIWHHLVGHGKSVSWDTNWEYVCVCETFFEQQIW